MCDSYTQGEGRLTKSSVMLKVQVEEAYKHYGCIYTKLKSFESTIKYRWKCMVKLERKAWESNVKFKLVVTTRELKW
jgi:hypothetical protein